MSRFRPNWLVKSTSLPSPDSPSSSGSEVLTNSTPRSSESSDSWDWDKSTTESLLELTRPQPTSWEELSPTSLSATLQEKPSENWCWREVSARWTSKESLFPATRSFLRHWASKASTQLKTSSTRSTLLVLTSRKPTTSYGHSSLEAPEEDSLPRDIPSKDAEIGETEKSTSTNLSHKCSDDAI